jgi:hypothetical protein
MALKRAFYPINTFDDISVGGVSDWRDVDVSALVPDIASGAILHAYVTSINYAVRPKGSTDSHGRTSNSNTTHRWSIVGLNAAKIFESYGGTLGPTLNLIGYTHRDYVKFFTNAAAITLAKTGYWETVDLAASCPGAVGIILETLVNSSPDSIGFRANGSTYTNINLSSGLTVRLLSYRAMKTNSSRSIVQKQTPRSGSKAISPAGSSSIRTRLILPPTRLQPGHRCPFRPTTTWLSATSRRQY